MAGVEVLEQPGVFRLPIEHLLRQRTRRRIVQGGEEREKPEVAGILGAMLAVGTFR